MSNLTECKNCSSRFEGKYCPNCGQPVIHQFTWRFVAASVIDALEFNKGLLFNFRQFTVRPKAAIISFLDGATKSYMNPVAYCLIGISLLLISVQLIDTSGDEDLYRQAELLTYIFVAAFPLLFSIILLGAGIGQRPNYLYGLIVSLFFTGHNLILLILIKIVLYIVSTVIAMKIATAVVLFVAVSLYYSVRFTQGLLGSGIVVTSLRLFSSTLVILMILFFAIGIIFTLFVPGRVNDLGYLLGRVVVVVFNFR